MLGNISTRKKIASVITLLLIIIFATLYYFYAYKNPANVVADTKPTKQKTIKLAKKVHLQLPDTNIYLTFVYDRGKTTYYAETLYVTPPKKKHFWDEWFGKSNKSTASDLQRIINESSRKIADLQLEIARKDSLYKSSSYQQPKGPWLLDQSKTYYRAEDDNDVILANPSKHQDISPNCLVGKIQQGKQ